MNKKIFFFVGLLCIFYANCALVAVEGVSSSGKLSVSKVVVNGFKGQILVVDKNGWKGLTKQDQLQRAKRLGRLYNQWNSGPDYLTILYARRYGQLDLF